eukprot:SAG31_NODE_2161_length_6297_cov_1.823169_2_plen_79_part_00
MFEFTRVVVLVTRVCWSFRGQRCGYAIERNIFLAHPNSTGGADAHHWHEPAEGICNVSGQWKRTVLLSLRTIFMNWFC